MVYDQYETGNGLVLFACSDTNRHKCPNLPKLEPAITQHDNGTGGDALTPQTTPRRAQC